MAGPQNHTSDVSQTDMPPLGTDDNGNSSASAIALTDSVVLAPDYRMLLTADASTETSFNRATEDAV